MTELEKSHRRWLGETKLINKELLSKYLTEAASPIYYIAGPPAMVKGLHQLLNKTGVDDDDIRSEEFSGY
jgi:Na+-transporting NADH:ubiquinone oxidoreductase subunit NqrF